MAQGKPEDRSMILAPICGIATPEDFHGFPPVMTARIKAFLYNQFFYLPQACPKTRISIAKEGIVRLDRLFAATPTRGLDRMDKKVSHEAMVLMLAVVRERLGAAEGEDMKAIRQLLFESLPKEALPELTTKRAASGVETA